MEELPKQIICQLCNKDSNQTQFTKVYYIPEGGQLPKGWVIYCRPCQIIFENALLSIGKSFSFESRVTNE